MCLWLPSDERIVLLHEQQWQADSDRPHGTVDDNLHSNTGAGRLGAGYCRTSDATEERCTYTGESEANRPGDYRTNVIDYDMLITITSALNVNDCDYVYDYTLK